MVNEVNEAALIFDVLEMPAVGFGRQLALLTPDAGVKVIDFGFYPDCVSALSPTPWRYAWASRGRHWYHLDKASGQCFVFDESSLPVYRDSGAIYPGTWLLEDDGDDGLLLGTNALGGHHPPLGVSSKSGFHFYRLRSQKLELLNQASIPFLIWSVWREGETLILVGMTDRGEQHAPYSTDTETSLGRPALIRCTLATGQWEEFSLTEAPVKDVHLFDDHSHELGHGLQFEAWIGSALMVDRGRVLLAAFVNVGDVFFDTSNELSVRPLASDYAGLAFVSFETKKIVHVEPYARLIKHLYVPYTDLFVICRDLDRLGQTVGGLYVFEPQSRGMLAQPLTIKGLDPSSSFSKFDAAYFGDEGFFGSVTLEADTFFLRSSDGLSWTVVGESSKIESRRFSDLIEGQS